LNAGYEVPIRKSMQIPAEPSTIRSVSASSDNDNTGHYRLSRDVVLVAVQDGTARLLDLGGSLFAVSETGAVMLAAALEGEQQEICDELAARFKLDRAQICSDMAKLLRDLEMQRLVKPPAVRHRLWPSLGGLLAWLIAPIVLACMRSSNRWLGARIWSLLTVSYFATRFLGWTNTIRVWQRCLGPERSGSEPLSGDEDMHLNNITQRVTRAIARHPLNIGCKERALCCWTLARAARLPARIVLGIDLFPFALHCWCESRSQILADRYEGRCDRYTPILTYR
jgi:hypothetical protein